jgi:hypothetical protein
VYTGQGGGPWAGNSSTSTPSSRRRCWTVTRS